MRYILAGGVERVGSMSRNRATAKQRKQQQYRYGYRASSQRTQGETVPEAFKPFAAEERCAERARLAEELAHAVSDVYARSREYKAARDRNENTLEITSMLQTLRDVERSAVHAYDDHIKKHGCKF